ncbi:hypothetical protein C0Q70_08924 [Pomacea canaliculata]|uniref:Uncharacterized protein n=1 Tax=Pomacea canaliculata TaxID=400727 RepID=A0A2T7P8D9_POMCA|nr:hypothetical protein C0Q70_08924 [Pomacea canaliculata]
MTSTVSLVTGVSTIAAPFQSALNGRFNEITQQSVRVRLSSCVRACVRACVRVLHMLFHSMTRVFHVEKLKQQILRSLNLTSEPTPTSATSERNPVFSIRAPPYEHRIFTQALPTPFLAEPVGSFRGQTSITMRPCDCGILPTLDTRLSASYHLSSSRAQPPPHVILHSRHIKGAGLAAALSRRVCAGILELLRVSFHMNGSIRQSRQLETGRDDVDGQDIMCLTMPLVYSTAGVALLCDGPVAFTLSTGPSL